MPALSASSIPAALARLAHADLLGPTEAPGLLAYLATIVTRDGAVAAAIRWSRSLPWPPLRS